MKISLTTLLLAFSLTGCSYIGGEKDTLMPIGRTANHEISDHADHPISHKSEPYALTRLKTEIGYNCADVWYKRFDCLKEATCSESFSITPGVVKQLELIRILDEDWRIRIAADGMLKSCQSRGDFSAARTVRNGTCNMFDVYK